jgi:hypothetical protein
MSKDERLAASQSITTLAIVEQVRDIDDSDELLKHAAKRSVYSPEEMRAMNPTPAQRLGVLGNHPYQSITMLSVDQYRALWDELNLGFTF